MAVRNVTPEQWEADLVKDGIPAVVDIHQAAAILRCGKRAVRSYRDSGDIASVHPAGSWKPILFARREIARYLATA